MPKETTKASGLGNKRDDTATIVAEIHGVTDSYVRKVVNGDRVNDAVLTSYIELKQGKQRLIEHRKNELLAAVNELVPFK